MKKYHNKNTVHVNNFTLKVKNIKDTVKYYEEVLGLISKKINDNKYELGTNDKVLFSLVTDDNVVLKNKITGLYHFALLLPSRKDLANFIMHLINNKYKVIGASDHGVSEAIYLEDTEGNGIEVYVDKKDELWPLNNDGVNMITKALDIDHILKINDLNEPFKIPMDTNIGHMHFHVKDIKEAKDFYSNLIGFNITQNMHSAIFLSDNKYHHHLGINIWNGVNIKDRSNNMTGLVSYNLNIPMDKKTLFIKKLKENNIEIYNDETNDYILDVNKVKVYF